MKRVRIIFFGTGEFAVAILGALKNNSAYEVRALITQPPRPVGRNAKIQKSAAHEFALAHEISVETPEKLNTEDFYKIISNYSADLIVVAQYGRIIPQAILKIPTYGALNVHGSLLPRWRGAAPVHAAIAAGDTETGITFMLMDEHMDHGPLLAVHTLTIVKDETTPALMKRLGELGAAHVVSTIDGYISGDIVPIPQKHEAAVYTTLLARETGEISATQQTAQEIERLARALYPWPGVSIKIEDNFIKIIRCHVDAEVDAAPKIPKISEKLSTGMLLLENQMTRIGTADGTLIIDEIQPAGKKIMTGAAFARGYSQFSGKQISEPNARRSIFRTNVSAPEHTAAQRAAT